MMIRFLRKFRNSMLTQNRFGKYLLYALGEILLVVIGILIALQVNNWNEQRAARKYEQTLLVELQEAVQNDMAFFGDHLLNNRNVFKREGHHYFERMIKGEKVDSSKFKRYFLWLRFPNTFHVNDGAYESIKSSGLDKISNKEIRNFITKLYEFDLPRYEDLLSYSYDELVQARENELSKLLDTPRYNIEDGFSIEDQLLDFDVKTNPHFIRLLEKSMQWEESSSRYYESMLEKYRELDSLLTAELNTKLPA